MFENIMWACIYIYLERERIFSPLRIKFICTYIYTMNKYYSKSSNCITIFILTRLLFFSSKKKINNNNFFGGNIVARRPNTQITLYKYKAVLILTDEIKTIDELTWENVSLDTKSWIGYTSNGCTKIWVVGTNDFCVITRSNRYGRIVLI